MISRECLGLIIFVVVLIPLYTYMLTKKGYIEVGAPLDSHSTSPAEVVDVFAQKEMDSLHRISRKEVEEEWEDLGKVDEIEKSKEEL
jgi:hypothetical protein